VAEALAAHGARLVLVARNEAQLEGVAAGLARSDREHLVVPLDLADSASLDVAMADLRQRSCHVDVLVANAGIAVSAPYHRAELSAWDRMMAVNARSVAQLGMALIPPMTEAGWGRVIVVASNAGLTGYTYSSAYCASKHAVIGWMRAVALEIARSGVTINALCPGWVDTAMADGAVQGIAATSGRSAKEARAMLERMSPQHRMVQPEEVAHWVTSLCAAAATSVHGQAIAIDGGQLL
jgi:NAD(P)-dependent dehydrogenase (short-subunit alcohol dehydrogenase family)